MEYSHQTNTTVCSIVGIKRVCEAIWSKGAFWYSENRKEDIDLVVSIPKYRSENMSRVPDDHLILLNQFREIENILERKILIELDCQDRNEEDRFLIDYSIQTNGGTVLVLNIHLYKFIFKSLLQTINFEIEKTLSRELIIDMILAINK